jgi:tripartite-type tricarboxylate transporter receptor subunit TctC
MREDVMIAKFAAGAVAAAIALAGLIAPAKAVFPEKDITFVIPFSPGGGFDTYVRLIAPFLEKHLPNKVNIIVKNVPGAGGRKGLTEVYRAKPDGHTIVIVNVPGAMVPPLVGEPVQYDLEKITWLTRLSTDAYLLTVSAKSPIKSFAEFKTFAGANPVKVPSTGSGSTAHVMSKVFFGVLGIKGQMVTGYKGTKEMTLAVIRGDTPAGILPSESTRKYIEAGDIRALMTTEDPSDYPGVPSAKSLGIADLDGLFIHRLVAAPPGLPAPIRATLSDAFMKAMNDPALKAAAEKVHRPFAPLDGRHADEAVRKQLALYLRFKDQLKD